MDNGVFEKELGKQRTLITLKQKLEVLDRAEELRKEKLEARRVFQEPRPRNLTRDEYEKFYEKKIAAKQTMNMNIQKEITREFPHLTRRSQICKWRKACARENWREMPEAVLSRVTATRNEWRSKMGLKKKGGNTLQKVPEFIQRELDLLMSEACGGLSDITERKEIVSMEDLASQPRYSTVTFLHHFEIAQIPC